MAAYNAGFGAVLRGVTRYNTERPGSLTTRTRPAVGHGAARAWRWPRPSSAATASASTTSTSPRPWPGRGHGAQIRAAPHRGQLPRGVSVEGAASRSSTRSCARTAPRRPSRLRAARALGHGQLLLAVRFGQLRDGIATTPTRSTGRFEDIATNHASPGASWPTSTASRKSARFRGGTVLVVLRVSAEEKQKNRAKAAEEFYALKPAACAGRRAMLVAVPDKDLALPGTRRVFYRAWSRATPRAAWPRPLACHATT